MSFNPNAGTFSGSSDVALSGATDGQLIGYDSAAAKWTNRTPAITAISGLQTALSGKANTTSPTFTQSGTADSVKIIHSGASGYALKVDRTTEGDVANLVNTANGGAYTTLGINASNTSYSVVKAVNDVLQTSGAIYSGIGTSPNRTATIFGSENAGQGPSYTAYSQQGSTGSGFYARYDNVAGQAYGPGLSIEGRHTAGAVARIENFSAHTSGTGLLGLSMQNASSTATVLNITNAGSGLNILSPNFRVEKGGAALTAATAVAASVPDDHFMFWQDKAAGDIRITGKNGSTFFNKTIADKTEMLATKNNVIELTDSTNDDFARINITDDSSATGGWTDRLAFYFSGSRTGYFNEYGELRARPAKDNTVGLRAMAKASAPTTQEYFQVAPDSSSAAAIGVSKDAINSTNIKKYNLYDTNLGGSYLQRTDLNYTLDTVNPELDQIYVNSFKASWRNEWGALRGTAPYTTGYGDALVRAIRSDADSITNSNALEIVDRRTGAGNNVMWGRKWTNGDLVRNGNTMADVYVIENGATPPSDLPVGTVIIEKDA